MKRSVASFVSRLPLLSFALEIILNRKFLSEYYSIIKDLILLKKDFKSIKIIRTETNDNDFFIVSSLGDSIYEAKLLVMTAIPLILRGGEGYVVLNRFQFWQKRFFKVMGINLFFYWDDYSLTKIEKLEVQKVSRSLIGLDFDYKFSSIKNLRYNDVKLGSQILSQISRDEMSAGFDPKAYKEKVNRLLYLSLTTSIVSEKILRDIPCNTGFSVEINGPKIGPLVCNATKLNIDIIQVVQPSRDDALILKRIIKKSRDFHPNSISAESLEMIYEKKLSEKMRELVNEEFENRYNGKWFLQSRNQPSSYAITKNELVEKYNLDSSLKTCCIFSHILWDANLFYGDDIYEDYSDWFYNTVLLANKNPNINFLVKLHPANIWKKKYENRDIESFAEVELINTKIGKLASNVKVVLPSEKMSTLSLFKIIDFAITVRGTSGFEAPCFGVKTILAGTGRFSGRGFTVDAHTVEEYEKLLLNLQELSPMSKGEVEKSIKHAYGVFKLRPWEFNFFKSEFNYKKTGRGLLDHNLRLDSSSIVNEEVTKNISHLYNWFKSDKVDYLI